MTVTGKDLISKFNLLLFSPPMKKTNLTMRLKVPLYLQSKNAVLSHAS